MNARFFVVDQNVLRRPDFELDRLLPFQSIHFVFPDTALVELVKPDNWEENVRKGFTKFLDIPHRCHMSLSIQEGIEFELQHGQPIGKHLLPPAFDSLLRDMIRASAGGAASDDIKARIESVRSELKEHDLHAEAAKEQVARYVHFLKAELSAADLAVCRAPEIARGARAVIANRAGRGFFHGYMRHHRVPYEVAAQLRRQRCLAWRWHTLRIHHALQWLGDGGIEGASPKTVLNDLLDQDYVVLGSFFTGLITREKAMRDASEDLDWIVRGARFPRVGRSKPRTGRLPLVATRTRPASAH